jgi:hypothetical protein
LMYNIIPANNIIKTTSKDRKILFFIIHEINTK